MLLKDINKYAQGLLDKNYSKEDIETLVLKFVGDEKIEDEDGNETVLKLSLEAKKVEKSVEFDIKEAVKEAIKEVKSTIVPKVFQPVKEKKIHVSAVDRFSTKLKVHKTYDEAYASGMFYRAALCGSKKANDWYLENKGIDIQKQNVQVEGTDTLGGYTVPTETSAALIDYSVDYGTFLKHARIENMLHSVKTIPRLDGTPDVAWIGENVTIPQTEITFDQITLTTNKLVARILSSNELFQDSVIAIGETISQQLSKATNNEIDRVGFNGDTDAGDPFTGIVTACEADGRLRNISGGTSNVTLTDINYVMGDLPQQYDNSNTKWFGHKKLYHEIFARLLAAAGGNTILTLEGSLSQNVLGYKYEYVDVMEPGGNNPSATTPIALFGDFNQCCIYGNKGSLTIQSNDRNETSWNNDGISIRSILRCAMRNDHNTNAMRGLSTGPV